MVLMGPGTRRTFDFPDGGTQAVIHFSSSADLPAPTAPMIFRVGQSGESLLKQVDQILRLGTCPRADFLLWNLLWNLNQIPSSQSNHVVSKEDEAMGLALGILHRDLGQQLRISEVVKASGLSHNRLTGLFKERFGDTIIGHLRLLRMTSAERMLLYSNQHIKSIAVDVGIPNLQRFNKVFRSHFGSSPRSYRQARLLTDQNLI